MKYYKLVGVILFVCFYIGCKNNQNQNTAISDNDYDKVLTDRENNAAGSQPKVEGTLINDISFEVKADKKDFENGIKPWASIEKPEIDLPNLIDKDQIVISEKKITIIIDYPLTNNYKFELISQNGFTREMLLTEISKNYYKLYEEEEKSATIKTLPMEKRTIYNRNQTNGKYGIWGHDMSDLVLSSIQVFKKKNGDITLVLGIDS